MQQQPPGSRRGQRLSGSGPARAPGLGEGRRGEERSGAEQQRVESGWGGWGSGGGGGGGVFWAGLGRRGRRPGGSGCGAGWPALLDRCCAVQCCAVLWLWQRHAETQRKWPPSTTVMQLQPEHAAKNPPFVFSLLSSPLHPLAWYADHLCPPWHRLVPFSPQAHLHGRSSQSRPLLGTLALPEQDGLAGHVLSPDPLPSPPFLSSPLPSSPLPSSPRVLCPVHPKKNVTGHFQVRNLCYMVTRREKMKHSLCDLQEKIFNLQIQLQEKDLAGDKRLRGERGRRQNGVKERAKERRGEATKERWKSDNGSLLRQLGRASAPNVSSLSSSRSGEERRGRLGLAGVSM
ncbi:hypothetical protein ACEWY4_009871 [Coilia grayii]|uniref:Uncharacterized protein n=1 Tax=Coilia grayii TaxID=363190 RepID=A0ABD1K7N8_9TELE